MWRLRVQDFFNLKGRNLDCWNLRFACLMLKILYAGCLGYNSLLKCARQLRNTKQNRWSPLFWRFKVVEGHWRWYPRKARQQCCGGSSLQHLEGHGPITSAVARTYNGNLEQSHQRGPGTKPLVREFGGGGEALLKLKHFWFLDV